MIRKSTLLRGAVAALLLLGTTTVYATPAVSGWGAAKASYDAGRIKYARLVCRGQMESFTSSILYWLPKDEVSAPVLRSHVMSIVELGKEAPKWENEHSKEGTVSPEALKQMERFRTALSKIREVVLKHKKTNDRAAAIAPQVEMALRDAVADEIAMLDKAGQKDKAKKLQEQYTAMVASAPALPSSLDPDGRAFLELSSVDAGPIQNVKACYVMHQPDAGRVRMLEKLINMRAAARDAVAKGKLTRDVAKIPRVMAYYVIDIADRNEKDKTNKSAFLVLGFDIVKDTVESIGRKVTDQTASDARKELSESVKALELLRQYGMRIGAIKGQAEKKASPPADFRNVDWRNAKVQVTGQDYQIISAINSFYGALAESDARKLKKLLAVGPKYATADELLSYLARRKSEGKFAKIAKYRVRNNTRYSISSGSIKKAMVSGLQAEVVIDKRPTIKSTSGMFDILVKDGKVMLGYPKNKLGGDLGSERS